jgi:predicted secreted protein
MTVRSAGELAWRRGKNCNGGECVEVALMDEKVIVRSSQDPDTTFQVSCGRWEEFVAGIKDSDFDGL